MIATIAAVLLGFAYLIRSADRRSRSAGGQAFRPAGKVRWTDEDVR